MLPRLVCSLCITISLTKRCFIDQSSPPYQLTCCLIFKASLKLSHFF